MSLGDALRLYDRPITRVENYCATGTDAFSNGCLAIASGAYDIVLVLGAEKLKDRGGRGLPRIGHPLLGKGNSAPGLFALAANRYMHTFGMGRETLAEGRGEEPLQRCAQSEGAPAYGGHRGEGAARRRSLPGHSVFFDCCPTTDGGAAAIICRADMAPRFRSDYILVKGFGLAVTTGRPYFDPTFDYLGFRSTQMAAQQAYKMAGVSPRDISFAEVHDCFTWTEISNTEDLGFCEKGHGGPRGGRPHRFDRGHSDQSEWRPQVIRASDRCQRRANDLRMCPATARQGGERQVKNPQLGLAHNVGGPGAVSCVVILGNN